MNLPSSCVLDTDLVIPVLIVVADNGTRGNINYTAV